jgi:hypothetical protein
MGKKITDTKQQQDSIRVRDKIVQNWMPYWSSEEECFKDAIITDPETKKKTKETFPRPIPMNQLTYENWLEKVINEKGEYYPQRTQEGAPVKGTGAKYVIKVITRIKSGKNEYLCSKGNLMGFNAAGSSESLWISYPEKWVPTNMKFTRIINEKTMSFDTLCKGRSGTEDVYELKFSAEAVDKMMKQVEDEDVQFIVKDDSTGDATQVKWSSVKESLRLFKEKSFDYLKMGDYIPAPVKAELRAKAEQQGLISKTYPSTTTGPSTRTEYLA